MQISTERAASPATPAEALPAFTLQKLSQMNCPRATGTASSAEAEAIWICIADHCPAGTGILRPDLADVAELLEAAPKLQSDSASAGRPEHD